MISSGIFMRAALAVALYSVTTACFPTMSGHEAFLARYGGYVGQPLKFFRDQFNYRNGYAPLTEKRLSNGNYEIEIDNVLPRSECKIFYEYNPDANIIVAWHYISVDNFNGCYVNPN
ncbi:MAG: hypothetical protein KGL51_10575 [Betaproteobacteria bacterium]|nr:hypothetical protein [Betaproteobacteria bacterium]MDE2325094.1 hypothetical protein [Betaproteobacteria bacterium]